MQRTATSERPEAQNRPGEGHPPVFVPLLAGISGRLGVNVKGQPAGDIEVNDGQVSVSYQAGDATAIANVEEREDFLRILRGELNPVVAAIQGRLDLEGDPEFAVEVILALNATKPFGTTAGGEQQE